MLLCFLETDNLCSDEAALTQHSGIGRQMTLLGVCGCCRSIRAEWQMLEAQLRWRSYESRLREGDHQEPYHRRLANDDLAAAVVDVSLLLSASGRPPSAAVDIH
mmetsp:Transcript_44496/g.125855  ORF Transcript_44496/g.125855 Transcript_44496/m.125855 type:complete len:104 (+) Transcript_44496:3-314(+)